jgi:uncharacterized protein YqfA (UPF0365 family)
MSWMILGAENTQPAKLFTLVVVGVMLLFLVVSAIVFWTIFRPWLQCFLSGTPISAVQLVAMKMRRTPVKMLCELKIMARQAGVDVSWTDLERSYLAGVDVELIVRSMIKAHGLGLELSWDQALDQAKQNQFEDYHEQRYES